MSAKGFSQQGELAVTFDAYSGEFVRLFRF